MDHAVEQRDPIDVLGAYLNEVEAMAASDGPFEILGHIDFPLRYGKAESASPSWGQVEEQARHVLEVLAQSGRVLEVNTAVPLDLKVVQWWHEAEGSAVSFGSDAHEAVHVGSRFGEVSAAVSAIGFRHQPDPTSYWARS